MEVIDALLFNSINNNYDNLADNTEMTKSLTQLETQLRYANVECKKILQETVKIIGILKKRQDAMGAQMQRLIDNAN